MNAPLFPKHQPFFNNVPTETTLFGTSATKAAIKHSLSSSFRGFSMEFILKNARMQTTEVGTITSPEAEENPSTLLVGSET